MATKTGPNLGLKYDWPLGTTYKTDMDANLRLIDSLMHLAVKSATTAAPPGSPVEGDRYIVGASASGTWAGKSGQVAVYIEGTWLFLPPKAGWRAYVVDTDTDVRYDGATWEAGGGGGVSAEEVDDRVASLLKAGSGIALTYDDAANKLTISSGGTDGTPAAFEYPAIADDNAFFADECTATTGWTRVGATGALTTDGTRLHLTHRSTATKNTGVSVPATADWLWLFKAKALKSADSYSYVELYNGTTLLLSVVFGYDWVAGANLSGGISAIGNADTQKVLLATGIDYSVDQEILVHVDRKFAAINFYRKDATGEWLFLGSMPYFAAMSSVNAVSFTASGANTSGYIDLDYLLLAKPNLMAIGDSVIAGHNHFDPDPAFYAGVDSNANSIWKHAKIYQGLRNNFIVNKGVGGNTSAQINTRIADVTAHGARLVFLGASSNDQVGGISQGDRTTNIQNSINSIVAAGANAILLNAVYVNANYGASMAAHNAYMRDWWDNYRSTLTALLGSLNINAAVADADGNMDTGYTESDGIHPNAAGYEKIGEYLVTRGAVAGTGALAGVDTANVFTKNQAVATVTLAYSANIAVDASQSNNFEVVLTGNATLDNPTNLVKGMVLNFDIDQDATGGRVISFGSMFKFPDGVAPTFATTANAKNSMSCRYDGVNLRCTVAKGFA